jgi:hypothetical protein
MSCFCLSSSDLHATAASICTRAIRAFSNSCSTARFCFCNSALCASSSAACFRKAAASFSFAEALSFRATTSFSPFCSSLLLRTNVLPSKINSPPMPTTTRIGPMEWANNLRNVQRSNEVDLRRIHFNAKSVRALILAQYSMTAPTARTSAETTAATSWAIRLFQI